MEESVSGFKTRGGWIDVVEHGERITRALNDIAGDRDDVDGDVVEEWNEWRPKSDERLDEDVNQKTAQQASVDEGEGEKKGKEPREDIRTAGEKLADSYENLEDADENEAMDKWEDSIDYVWRAADSAGRKALRTVEDAVYRNVMTQIAPYYFDNELISANLQRLGSREDPEYVFEVNINDDDLKTRVSNKLADYEQEHDRWHVDTPKETEAGEIVEGVEAPVETTEPTEPPNGDPDAKTN